VKIDDFRLKKPPKIRFFLLSLIQVKGKVIIFFFFLTLAGIAQKPFNSDSLFSAFTNGEDTMPARTRIDHYLEMYAIRMYETPSYSYATTSTTTCYLTGGVYKLYLNGKHGMRLGFESNKDNYGIDIGSWPEGSSQFGVRIDRLLRYGYERVLIDEEYVQLYVLSDLAYVSSLAHTTNISRHSTYSDPRHPPQYKTTYYDSISNIETRVVSGLAQIGCGVRLLAGNFYLSLEMAGGVNFYKKEATTFSETKFTNFNYWGQATTGYDKKYEEWEPASFKLAVSATFFRLGVGYRF
jgi:hypothetical protein